MSLTCPRSPSQLTVDFGPIDFIPLSEGLDGTTTHWKVHKLLVCLGDLVLPAMLRPFSARAH